MPTTDANGLPLGDERPISVWGQKVQSSTEPERIYDLFIYSDGTGTCTCRGWIFYGRNRDNPAFRCSHIKKVMANIEVQRAISAARQGQAAVRESTASIMRDTASATERERRAQAAAFREQEALTREQQRIEAAREGDRLRTEARRQRERQLAAETEERDRLRRELRQPDPSARRRADPDPPAPPEPRLPVIRRHVRQAKKIDL